MVVFTCNNCGESLQKPRVEKHYNTVCRSRKNLTCVDCFKDFWGEDYVSHTKCVTESQRYAAKGSMPQEVVTKGESKQKGWVDMISQIVEKELNLSQPIKNLLQIVGNYSNVPRKKAKFYNFISNCLGKGRYNARDLDAVWDLFEKYNNLEKERLAKLEQEKKLVAEQKPNEQDGDASKKKKKAKKGDDIENNDHANEDTNGKQNGDTSKRKLDSNGNHNGVDVPKKKKKTKNHKAIEATEENGVNGKTETCASDDLFNYENTIMNILNEKNQISLKKLEKRVLKAYLKSKGVDEYTDKQVKKFNKRLKKIPNVEIKDDMVMLT